MTQGTHVDCELTSKKCKPCEGGVPPLTSSQVEALIQNLDGWAQTDHKEISKTFKFKNYHETMAFVNATAWISHREDHHPDLEVGYNKCVMRYSTHAVGGLSENDFICAAKIEALMKL